MLALTIANLKMLGRNRQTVFWALFFPLILVVVFGLFDFTSASSSDIAIIDQANSPASRQLVEALGEIDILNLKPSPVDTNSGRRLVADGDLDYLVVVPQGFASRNDPLPAPALAAPAKEIAPVSLVLSTSDEERNQLLLGILRGIADEAVLGTPEVEKPVTLVVDRVSTRVVPYFDLVLFGLVGMGIMTHAIISIAARISNYRNLSILKRMLATPLPIWKFFAAEVTAQLVLALLQAAVILAVGVFVFRAQVNGNILHLLPPVILGGLVFLNIGFIVSAYANSPTSASGMGNAISFPMMFFAGTFFSTSSLPWLLPYLADALPLAPMLTALRDIGIHGATIWEVWPEMAILAGWVAATSLVAIKVFRFS